MYKKFYQRFLEASAPNIYFTAHSHHFWPDITRDAVLQCWEDAAKYVDKKWIKVLSEVIPQTQELIAQRLNLKSYKNISFAQNTHEFIVRLFSCFGSKKIKILATDQEFHSFSRQIKRMIEENLAEVTFISAEPAITFQNRLEAMKFSDYDIIFLSHVPFSLGQVLIDLKSFNTQNHPMIVLDTYHSFMALETDFSSLENRIFILGGSYKYAQGGEGACFLVSPEACALRPVNTGWFADFSSLDNPSSDVHYLNDGFRFWGSTFDPTALYRLRSSLVLLQGLSSKEIHQHSLALQDLFNLGIKDAKFFRSARLINQTLRSNYLVYEFQSHNDLDYILSLLERSNIVTDHRGLRLRFGFGLHHDNSDIDEFFNRMSV